MNGRLRLPESIAALEQGPEFQFSARGLYPTRYTPSAFIRSSLLFDLLHFRKESSMVLMLVFSLRPIPSPAPCPGRLAVTPTNCNRCISLLMASAWPVGGPGRRWVGRRREVQGLSWLCPAHPAGLPCSHNYRVEGTLAPSGLAGQV